MAESIVLLGGGGHCRSCIEVIRSTPYNIHGILDEKPEPAFEYEVLGDDSLIPVLAGTHRFLITVGQVKTADVRSSLYEKIMGAGGALATVISGSALVSVQAEIGEGTIVMHHAIVNANTRIGVNCIINNKALIEHDTAIGDHVHISTGAIVNGACNIGNRCFIGSGALIIQGLSIGDDVIIGAGTVVTKDITGKGVYAGNPAKKIS